MTAYKELDSWIHLAVVADGSQSKVYINGELFHTFNVVSDDDIDIFGNDTWSQGLQKWANYIADVRYWDAELTAQQILELYNQSKPLGTGTNPLLDSPTLNNGATITGGVLELDQDQDSYAVLPTSDDYEVGSADTTIHFWMYPTSDTFTAGNVSGHSQTILAKHNTGSNPNNYGGYAIGFGESGHHHWAAGDTGIKVFSCDGGSCGVNNNTIFRVAGGVPLNQWHHVAITYNDTTNVHTCYFNGQPIGTPWTKPLPGSTNKSFYVGGSTTAGRTFDGKLKKINIVKSILTPQEIQTIYNEG